MAGVRSPYFDPDPVPFPPVVMWMIWPRPENLDALKSNETLHCSFKRGRVVRRVFFLIACSSSRAKMVSHGSAKDATEGIVNIHF